MNGRQDVLSVKHSASRRQDDLVIKKGPEGPSFLYTSGKFIHAQKRFLLFLHEPDNQTFFFAKLNVPLILHWSVTCAFGRAVRAGPREAQLSPF